LSTTGKKYHGARGGGTPPLPAVERDRDGGCKEDVRQDKTPSTSPGSTTSISPKIAKKVGEMGAFTFNVILDAVSGFFLSDQELIEYVQQTC